MTAIQVKIRDGVYDAIKATPEDYVIADFDIEKTYFPQENLEDLSEKPKIKVVAMNVATDRDRQLRRAVAMMLNPKVQVCIQKAVSPTDTETIDLLVEFCEQVMERCEDDELVDGEAYQYQRTEPLLDENGLEYSYEDLRTKGVFQSVFTVYFQTTKQ